MRANHLQGNSSVYVFERKLDHSWKSDTSFYKFQHNLLHLRSAVSAQINLEGVYSVSSLVLH